MRSSSEEQRAFVVSMTLLRPLPDPARPDLDLDLANGPLELAQTSEGAARFEQWLTTPPPMQASGLSADAAAVDEAYVAYAEGRIDSRHLMEMAGITQFHELVGGLHMRGLTMPVTPTVVGPGRDDRDLLWESYTQPPP
jgi:hypothetical protein